MSNKKHKTIDESSRRFRTVSNDIDKTNEIDIDDFIDVEMNCVRIVSVRMTVKNEKILLSKYLNESKEKTVWLIILRKFANTNIKQFLKFKMHVFKHLIREKHLFRQINKNGFMGKMINNLIIKTQIFEVMHEKSDYRKKRNLSKNRDKIILIRNYARGQKSFENLWFMLTKSYFEKKKYYISFESTFCDKKFALT